MTMTPALKQFISREFHKVPDVAKFAALGRGAVYDAVTRGDLKAWRSGPATDDVKGKRIRIRTTDALTWLGIDLPTERQDAEGNK